MIVRGSLDLPFFSKGSKKMHLMTELALGWSHWGIHERFVYYQGQLIVKEVTIRYFSGYA